MLEAIESRELFTLDGAFPAVRGTYHRPCDKNYRAEFNYVPRVGVLFLSGLYATRSANGDAAVYWANSLAARGYPAFRIDLPGFGDAHGDPPEDWLGYIDSGGYASVTSACARQIVQRFGLSGLVIAGHCAGAVSAVYAAAVSKECCGLVLMDPYFYLPQVGIPKVRQQLNVWARKSRVGGLLSQTFDLMKHMRLMFTRGSLPENANMALLRCWKQVASAGLPILTLKAPRRGASGEKPRVGEFDYSNHILKLAGARSQLLVKLVDGANHSFSNNQGRAAVRQIIELWLSATFPLGDRDHNTVTECCHDEVAGGSVNIGATNIA